MMVMKLGVEELQQRLSWNSFPLPEVYMGAVLIFTLTFWSNLFIWLHSTVMQLLEGLEAEDYFLSTATEDQISDWLNRTADSEDEDEDYEDFYDEDEEEED